MRKAASVLDRLLAADAGDHGGRLVRPLSSGLCDVDGRGVSRNVTDGILRLRPGRPESDVDGVVAAEVQLDPTAYRFRRGHRLRLQVAGGAFPRFARNHGTDEPVFSAVGGKPARSEIFHDPAWPSRITLPVFDG